MNEQGDGTFSINRDRGLRKLEQNRSKIKSGGTFLIIQFRQIGDVLLTLPMARAIKQGSPQSTVYFCTEPAAAPLVSSNPHIDHLLIREKGKGIRADFSLIRKIRALHPDVVIDGIKTPSSGWMSLLSAAPIRIAFDHPLRRYFYTITISPHLTCGYTLDEKLVLLAALGFSPFEGDFRSIDVIPDRASEEKVAEFLTEKNLAEHRPLIAVAPTSRRITRRWPAEHFARLIDLLAEHCNTKSIILWGPGEEEYARHVASLSKVDPTVFFRSTLLELTALIRKVDLLIGNDSAPRHLAFSQKTPSVVIHGSTGIGAWTPPIPEHIAFSLDASCQPCNKNACETLECLLLLKPEQIIEQIVTHLQHFSRRG